MKKTWYAFTLLAILLAIAVPVFGNIACTISTTCSNTTVLRMQNDTGGYQNAHAQLPSYGTLYNYLLCCESNGQILDTTCNGNYTNLTRLSNDTNAHIQDPNNSSLPTIYPVMTCISANRSITCGLNQTSCSSGYSCIASMASSEGNNFTNAHISDCSGSGYSLKICCRSNSPPAAPTATYPNLTTTITDRYTVFNWTTVTDPDLDAITYQLNVTAPSGLGCFGFTQSGIPTINYTSITELCTDLDHSAGSYSYQVRACDSVSCGPWSNTAIFNVTSVNSISLNITNTSFGNMARDTEDNTTDNNPWPMTVVNDGNIRINISAKGNNSLFDSFLGLNDTSFQFSAGTNETNSFNTTRSQMGFINVTNQSQNLITTLLYLDVSDQAEIEYRVYVPFFEPIGSKSANIVITSTPDLPS